MPRNLLLAITVILIGILAFDMMGILVRMLGGSYPVLQIAALRNLFGVIPSLLLLWHARQLSSLPNLNRPRFHLINLVRATSVVMAQFCFYTALTKIEFATAAALGFSGPIFITALSVPLLGHHIGRWRWGAVFVAVGVATICPPDDGFSQVVSGDGGLLYAVSAFSCASIHRTCPRRRSVRPSSRDLPSGEPCLLFVDPQPVQALPMRAVRDHGRRGIGVLALHFVGSPSHSVCLNIRIPCPSLLAGCSLPRHRSGICFPV